MVSVSIVVAAFNEGPTIAPVLERIVRTLRRREALDWELIVVDDGSSDDTATILQRFSASHGSVMSAITHDRNRGLVAAMATGTAAARKDTVAFLDADLSYEPEIVARLLEAKEATHAAVAVASPYMKGGRVANVPFDRLLASRGANWILARCARGSLHTFTGMVRAYDAAFLREIFEHAPVGEFNTWALAEAIERNRSIVEIPAALVWPRERFEAPSRISPRKLLMRAGLVLETARHLTRVCRKTLKRKTGTLVLDNGSDIPYSLLAPARYK